MMMKYIQKGYIFLALFAAALLAASPANAVDFAISGQINRATLYADDGDTASWFFVDNDNSSTRFRFTGGNDFERGWKVGIVWEVQFESNSSSAVSMDSSNTELGGDSFTERKIEFWVEKWGRLWVGQGDMASNGTSEVSLSGTDVAAYSDIAAIGGKFEFKDDGDEIGVTVGSSRSNFDGLSRRDRLRYDSPKWAGFYASGSVGQGDIWDVTARYAGDFGWAKLAAAAAYSDGGTRFDYDGQFSSSASLLFDFGLNFTASYATQDSDTHGDDPWNIFGKVGYKFLEKHAASVQWSRTENRSAEDDKGDSLGLAYVFSPWKSIEFYGTYYLHMLDRDEGSDPDDINIGMAGGRVKF
jgi:Gram-negative porin